MSQLTKGNSSRLMYIENKSGDIDGAPARIGFVTFSKTGRSIYYRDLTLKRMKGGGVSGNYYCEETDDEYWVSGVKKRDSNTHWAESTKVLVDSDALEEYERVKSA